jgi:hypothetical protein
MSWTTETRRRHKPRYIAQAWPLFPMMSPAKTATDAELATT